MGFSLFALAFSSCAGGRRLVQGKAFVKSPPSSNAPESGQDGSAPENGSSDNGGNSGNLLPPYLQDIVALAKNPATYVPYEIDADYIEQPEAKFFEQHKSEKTWPTGLFYVWGFNTFDIRASIGPDEGYGTHQGSHDIYYVTPWSDEYPQYFIPTYKDHLYTRPLNDYEIDFLARVFYLLVLHYNLAEDESVHALVAIPPFYPPVEVDGPPPFSERVDAAKFVVTWIQTDGDSQEHYVNVTFPEFDGKYGQLQKDIIQVLEFFNYYHFGLLKPVEMSQFEFGYHPDYAPQ